MKTSKGVDLVLKPVSQFKIDSLRMSKVELPVPTYTMKVVGGESLNYPMDEAIAKNQDRMDEWNAYVAEKAKADSEYMKKFLDLLIWESVEIEIPDKESEWQKANDYFGIKIPDSAVERKLFYVYNECLGSPDDIGELMADIFSVSKIIDEEAVTKLRASFRLGVSRQANSRVRKAKK